MRGFASHLHGIFGLWIRGLSFPEYFVLHGGPPLDLYGNSAICVTLAPG